MSRKAVCLGVLVFLVAAGVFLGSRYAVAADTSRTIESDIAPDQFHQETPSSVPQEAATRGGWQYSFLDVILAAPFKAIAGGLSKVAEVMKMQPVEKLVFNMNAEASPMADAFTSDEWYGLVLPWYRAVLAFGTSVIVIESVILLKSYGFIASPSKRSTVQEMLFNTGFAVLLAFGTPVLMRLILDANKAVVAFARSQAMSMSPSSSLEAAKQASGSAILDAVISIADVGLMIYMNILYLVRKFVLGILLIIAPVVGWSWMSRGTRQTALLMLSELVTNGMMTASHALPYAFFLTMLRLNGGLLGTAWAKLLGFALIIPLSAFLRRMLIGFFDFLGMHEESAASAALGGMASLAAVGAVMLGTVAEAGANYAGTAISSAPVRVPSPGVQTAGSSTQPQVTSNAGQAGTSPAGGAILPSVDRAGGPVRGESTNAVSNGVSGASVETPRVVGVNGVNPEIQDIISGEAGELTAEEEEIDYDPAPSALNPLLSYRIVSRPRPGGDSGSSGSSGGTDAQRLQKAGQTEGASWKRTAAVAAGAAAAGLGVATKVAGALVSLSAGPVGRQIGSAGQPLYDAGIRIVHTAVKRRVTADESRYWRQMPEPGELGRNAEAQPRPSAA